MYVLVREEFIRHINGMYYHGWKLLYDEPVAFEMKDVAAYCLLLPVLGPDGLQGTMTSYTAVDSNWMEIDQRGDFVPPRSGIYNTF